MFTDIVGVKLTSVLELSNNRFLFDLNTAKLSFRLANQNSEALRGAGFNPVTGETPIVLEISYPLQSINRIIFGERIEEIIRILGDTENGILFVSRESNKFPVDDAVLYH